MLEKKSNFLIHSAAKKEKALGLQKSMQLSSHKVTIAPKTFVTLNAK